MNTLSLALLVVLAAMATTAMAEDKTHYDLKDAEKLFEKFIKDYNKHYKDEADKKVHFEAFKKALVQINKQNEDNPHATFGITKFTDYTEAELQQIHGFGTVKKP